MADIEKIAEDLSNLTVLEAAELAKLLEDKWGVSAAAAPVAMAMPAGGGDAGGAAEEKSEFDVILTAAGASKINVIKEVRAPTKSKASSRKLARPSRSSKPDAAASSRLPTEHVLHRVDFPPGARPFYRGRLSSPLAGGSNIRQVIM